MPMTPRPEDRALALRETQEKEQSRETMLAVARQGAGITHHEHVDTACTQTMKNWVIKTLCGFRVVILERFVVYYPELTEEFVKLDAIVGDVIHKCRQANHKYTRK